MDCDRRRGDLVVCRHVVTTFRARHLILACGVLSVIVVAVALSLRWGWFDGSLGFLAIGILIVTLAGIGAHWLLGVARAART